MFYSFVLNTFRSLLWLKPSVKSAQSPEKWQILIFFCRLCPFPQVSGPIKDWLILELHEEIRVLHVFLYLVYFALWSWSASMCVQTYEKCWAVSNFSCLSPAFLLLEPLKEWLIRKLHEMIKVSHIFTCPIIFIMLCAYLREMISFK